MIRRFARPYARAILDVAGSPEVALDLHRELRGFEDARSSSRELEVLFANPAVHLDQQVAIAAEIGKRIELSSLGLRIIEVLVRNRRINQLGSILEALRQMVHEALGISVASVTTAHELSDAQRGDLQEALESRFARKIELELETKPELLGGFVARVGSEIYDTSVRGRLVKLRESLT